MGSEPAEFFLERDRSGGSPLPGFGTILWGSYQAGQRRKDPPSACRISDWGGEGDAGEEGPRSISVKLTSEQLSAVSFEFPRKLDLILPTPRKAGAYQTTLLSQ